MNALLALCALALALNSPAAEAASPLDTLPPRAFAAIAAGKQAAAEILTKASTSYLEIKPGSYIAPTCQALVELGALFTNSLTDTSSKLSKFAIQLPCTAGTLGELTWSTPNYTCVDPASGNATSAIFQTDARAGSVTISAMVKGGGCVLPGKGTPVLPIIKGGGKLDPNGDTLQILSFGSANPGGTKPLQLTASINGLQIMLGDGEGRPAIGAYVMKTLSLKNVAIVGAQSLGGGAAIDASDTAISWVGTKGGEDKVFSCKSTGLPLSAFSFPGAGGAIALAQNTAPSPLSVSNVRFSGNSHTNYGGVFYVWKRNPGATKATFKTCTFDTNTASVPAGSTGPIGSALGFTLRDDGSYKTADVGLPGKALSVALTAPVFISGQNNVGGDTVDYRKLMLAGMFKNVTQGADGKDAPMPIDPKQKTKATGLSVPTYSGLPSTPFNDTIWEYFVFVDSQGK